MSKNSLKIEALLSKLKAMAEGGEEHEREVALTKMNELLKKYGLNSASYKKQEREFKVLDWTDHKNLLLQCIIDSKHTAKMKGDKSRKRIAT